MTDDLTPEEKLWHDPKTRSKMMRAIFAEWSESEEGKRHRARWSLDTSNPNRVKAP